MASYLDHADVRAALLYFARLAFNVIEGGIHAYLFIDSNKYRAKRRRSFKAAIDRTIEKQPNNKRKLEDLKKRFAFKDNRRFNMELLCFSDVLGDLPEGGRGALERSFQQEQGFADWDFKTICQSVAALKTARDFLTHYENRLARGETLNEQELFSLLGRLLLPSISADLEGKIKHYVRRDKMRDVERVSEKCAHICAQIAEGRTKRKKERVKFHGETMNKKTLSKERRRQLHQRRDRGIRERYQKFFSDEERMSGYRLSNFRDHELAIGKKRMRYIRERLIEAVADDKYRPSFYEFERLYRLEVDLGFELSLILGRLEPMIDIEKDFKVLKSARNNIMHGLLFSQMFIEEHAGGDKIQSPQECFYHFFCALKSAGRQGDWLGEFEDRLMRLIKKQRRKLIFDSENIKRADIPIWHQKKREQFMASERLKKKMSVQNYRALRKITAQYHRALKRAWASYKS